MQSDKWGHLCKQHPMESPDHVIMDRKKNFCYSSADIFNSIICGTLNKHHGYTMTFNSQIIHWLVLSGRGRHWNFDPLQCLGPRPEILDRYISLSCLRWLPTACHERLAYFHWPQWVTWLVTWWVTWSRWPDAGRHIGKFSLWTTLLRFSRSAQISLFSNFTKLGQLFFDNIFFGLTS